MKMTNMEDEKFSFLKADGTFNEKWAMIDFLPGRTGLPMIIFIINKNSVSDDNGPRIRVAIHNDCFVNTSTDLTSFFFGETYVKGGFDVLFSPEVFEQIEAFIKLNKTTLLDFWNVKINGAELIDKIKKI